MIPGFFCLTGQDMILKSCLYSSGLNRSINFFDACLMPANKMNIKTSRWKYERSMDYHAKSTIKNDELCFHFNLRYSSNYMYFIRKNCI